MDHTRQLTRSTAVQLCNPLTCKCSIHLTLYPHCCGPTTTGSYASLCAPCRPPEAGPTPPSVGYGHVECITGPTSPRLDVVPARSGSEHLPKPPSIGPVNKVCDSIDDCVRARSCREPVLKRHVKYDVSQHIPAGYEQRTTYTDALLHDRRA